MTTRSSPQDSVPQQMICPNCGFEQPRSDECTHCGVIIEKYLKQKKQDFIKKRQRQQQGQKLTEPTSISVEEAHSQEEVVQLIESPKEYVPPMKEAAADILNARRKKGVRLVYIVVAMITIITLVSGVIGFIQYTEYRRNKRLEAEKQQQIEEEARRLEKLEEAKAAYLSTGKEVVKSMFLGVVSAVDMCGEISEAWSNSIKWGTDFNDAIRRRVKELDSSYGKIIRESRENVDELMQELDVVPEGMERHQHKMFELYGEFNKLCNQAVSPSGSLMTYNRSINNSQENFLQLLNEVKVLYKID